MRKIFVLATECANGFTMPALWRHSCGGTDCNGDALWYAAQMHGFYAGCCGVRTSLQHVGCRCGSAVLCNDDAVVVHSVHNDYAAVVRSVSNSASTFIHNCIADDVASMHHRACSLRCKVVAKWLQWVLQWVLQCCSIPLRHRCNMGAEVLHY